MKRSEQLKVKYTLQSLCPVIMERIAAYEFVDNRQLFNALYGKAGLFNWTKEAQVGLLMIEDLRKSIHRSPAMHSMKGWDLSDVCLRKADLVRCNLDGADLSGANLTKANLYRTKLSGADLTGAKLFCAHMKYTDLRSADLTGADLRGCDLRTAKIGEAIIADTRCDLTYFPTTVRPANNQEIAFDLKDAGTGGDLPKGFYCVNDDSLIVPEWNHTEIFWHELLFWRASK